jgi:hypothetical protein
MFLILLQTWFSMGRLWAAYGPLCKSPETTLREESPLWPLWPLRYTNRKIFSTNILSKNIFSVHTHIRPKWPKRTRRTRTVF